jgi:ribosomal protein L7/L12
MIIDDKRIAAIKIVRSQTRLGLKDAKDIVYENWNDWQILYRD